MQNKIFPVLVFLSPFFSCLNIRDGIGVASELLLNIINVHETGYRSISVIIYRYQHINLRLITLDWQNLNTKLLMNTFSSCTIPERYFWIYQKDTKLLLKGVKATKGETCNVEYCITSSCGTFVEKPQLEVTFVVFKTEWIMLKIR